MDHEGIPAPLAPLLHAGGLRLPSGVAYGFTTRQGGVSAGPYATLTLARDPAVPERELVENWRRALVSLDRRLEVDQLVLMNQVHGDRVLVVDEATGPLATAGDADAMVTTERRLALAVRVADCVPVVFASPRAVAVAHAGWRGVAARIVPKTVAALLDLTGERAEAVVAVVGPHIGVDAFEVGPEVVDGVRASGVDARLFAREGKGDRWHVDLGAAVDAQLRGVGVQSVGRAGSCSTGPRFFSWRRDQGRTGRMAGLVVRW